MVVEIKKFKKEETAVVTSIDVAETFGKEHKNVLKDTRELDCSEEFRRLNFEQSSYINAQKKKTTDVLHDERWIYFIGYGIYW